MRIDFHAAAKTEAVPGIRGVHGLYCLELAFRERETADRQVVAALTESVAHWAPYADTGLATAQNDRVPSPA
mgnify:CR=1 FL=1